MGQSGKSLLWLFIFSASVSTSLSFLRIRSRCESDGLSESYKPDFIVKASQWTPFIEVSLIISLCQGIIGC